MDSSDAANFHPAFRRGVTLRDHLAPPIQKSFSTLGCPDYTLKQALALATSTGFDAIELRMLGGTADLPDYLVDAYGTPARLAERMRGRSVRIGALGTSFTLLGDTPAASSLSDLKRRQRLRLSGVEQMGGGFRARKRAGDVFFGRGA